MSCLKNILENKEKYFKGYNNKRMLKFVYKLIDECFKFEQRDINLGYKHRPLINMYSTVNKYGNNLDYIHIEFNYPITMDLNGIDINDISNLTIYHKDIIINPNIEQSVYIELKKLKEFGIYCVSTPYLKECTKDKE